MCHVLWNSIRVVSVCIILTCRKVWCKKRIFIPQTHLWLMLWLVECPPLLHAVIRLKYCPYSVEHQLINESIIFNMYHQTILQELLNLLMYMIQLEQCTISGLMIIGSSNEKVYAQILVAVYIMYNNICTWALGQIVDQTANSRISKILISFGEEWAIHTLYPISLLVISYLSLKIDYMLYGSYERTNKHSYNLIHKRKFAKLQAHFLCMRNEYENTYFYVVYLFLSRMTE